MVTIVHNDYERMADTFFNENRDWMMKFVLMLNSYNEDGNKINFHKEFIYRTKKTKFAVSINREFKYFFELSANTPISPDIKVTVKIYPEDFYIFREKINNVIDFIKNNITTTKDGKLHIKKRSTDKVVCKFGQYIELEPYIDSDINVGDDSIQNKIGVHMYINSNEIKSFIPINQLMYLASKMNEFNMDIHAKLMANYLGRPENGTNVMDMINYVAPENSRTFSLDINKPYQSSNNNKPKKSFFDKVNVTPKEGPSTDIP